MWGRSRGQTRGPPLLGLGYNLCYIWMAGLLTLADVPDMVGPPPDLVGVLFIYFFYFWSRALLGHFGGATWHPLIGPRGILDWPTWSC
jgi:hypothetical protein